MTWVKGTTTWGNLSQDMTRLITGEIADGSATTVASGDRWVREQTRSVTDGVLNTTTTLTSATAAFTNADVGSRVFGTGIPSNTTISSVTNGTTVVMSAAATASASGVSVQICMDTIRTPASLDVATGSCSNRTGYFALYSGSNTAVPGGISTVARVSNPFTSDPSTSGFHRWYVQLTVTVANTVSGNYSTATVLAQTFDGDSGNTLASTSSTPTAGGVVTIANGLQVTLSDPSGFLTPATTWRRGFTPTYMYGVDEWPAYSRRSGAATFSVAPPGSAGTDYDIIDQVAALNPYTNERGILFSGLGIKTATGLGSGALYTVSWNMAYAKGRIFNSTTTGTLGLDVGRVIVDTGNLNVMRVSHGIRSQTWAKVFQTAGSVSNSTSVQYWMSVKSTGIMVALQGDPGFTGKLSTAYFGDVTPYDATYDVFPIVFNAGQADYTSNTPGIDGAMNFDKGYWRLRRSTDGSEGTRDWQTRWMRSDFGTGDSYGNGFATDLSAITTINVAFALGYATDQQGTSYGYTPARQNKPVPVDGKWWFYGAQYSDMNMGQGGVPGAIDERRMVRSYQNSRYLYLPSEGWSTGDELTDTFTTQKYLLLTPDYMAQGGRMRTATSTYFGGIAIAEL